MYDKINILLLFYFPFSESAECPGRKNVILLLSCQSRRRSRAWFELVRFRTPGLQRVRLQMVEATFRSDAIEL